MLRPISRRPYTAACMIVVILSSLTSHVFVTSDVRCMNGSNDTPECG